MPARYFVLAWVFMTVVIGFGIVGVAALAVLLPLAG